MKILIFVTLISLASCWVNLPDEAKTAKSMDEHPTIQKILREKNPELFNENGEIIKKTPFIIGGSNATFGQFPHQALLFTYVSETSVYLCGGSLIRYNWVLTAAHCVYIPFMKVAVYLGIIDSYYGPAYWGADVTSTDVKIHSGYNDNYLTNDIAMIYLRTATESILNAYIGTIPLPKSHVNTNLDGRSSIVSGFGKTSDNSTSSQFLKYVQLYITSNSVCEQVYGPNYVRDTNICVATTNTAATCSGDSGGPLTTVLDGTNYVVGIVSFGAAISCEMGYPAGFTRVTSFIGWIEDRFTLPPAF
ncbi:hypothetical protein PVAND_016613 [Polypedilum vanderplanki]|uniref:Peptidase S1 domain-containing protein n=1 Tax=Polypedilum vanderplanki TaxID=319348 RepID=A0A9J6BFM3_POLVA|nr:hypothetical protein PVAND_016613 [Polypedilum vanderplanki]